MKVLFCSPEVYPFSKIGGLADFSAFLPKALNNLGNTVNVVSPYYERVKKHYGDQLSYIGQKEINFGEKRELAKYYHLELNGTNYYFIGHEFFDRKTFFNHSDDAKRFIFFNIAILEMLNIINFYPDIIHLNDWTSALIPYFLDEYYRGNENFTNIKTLLTIHNLEKQGNYPKIYEKYFTKKNFTYLHLDNINFLKTGIMRANQINTVSKTYKEEILTKFYGFSLDGALKSRQNNLHGIQNGIDFDLYNPNMDGYIYQQYDIKNFKKGKLNNKTNLIKSIGFKDPNKMVVSFISRFANEKGIHLIMESIDKYLENDQIYFLVIGEGDFQFEEYFKTLSDKYPNNCYFVKGHNQEISQNFYAASDIILMPSLYEASGLNQLIALRYGTLPIVRQTGGLTDTVIPYNKETKTGYGFVFENFDDEELSQAIDLSLDTYLNDQDSFNQMIKNGMELNNSIDKMALAYQDLYKLTIK